MKTNTHKQNAKTSLNKREDMANAGLGPLERSEDVHIDWDIKNYDFLFSHLTTAHWFVFSFLVGHISALLLLKWLKCQNVTPSAMTYLISGTYPRTLHGPLPSVVHVHVRL